ncbi:MAG: chemotaxis protein CheW [Methylococcales bacterium]|nr:chemotaxis protein CheW [Methylococcales bacterium]
MADTIQLLSFSLANEQYAVNILNVQEIRSLEPVTRIPNAPVHEKGVLNLRGVIVPIIDLREKFSLPRLTYNALTVVVVLQCQLQDTHRVMGMIVDSVSDVVDVDSALIQKTPGFGDKVNTDYIKGLASSDEHMLMLLDVEKLMNLNPIEEQTGFNENRAHGTGGQS